MKRFSTTVLAAGFIGLLPATSFAMTLEDAVKTAITTHPDVTASIATQKAAHAQISDERAGFLPVINLKAEAGYEKLSNASVDKQTFHKEVELTAIQMIFDGFAVSNRTDAAESRSKAATEAIKDKVQSVAVRAIEAYLEIVRLRQIVTLAKENVTAHAEVVEDVTFRTEGGGGEQADVFQAQSRELLAKDRLRDFEGRLRLAEADFNEAVGSFPESLDAPNPSIADLPANLEDALTIAVERNPVMTTARHTVDAFESDHKAQKAVYSPTLNLEMSEVHAKDVAGVKGMATSREALLVLRYNFYRGGRDKARIQRTLELASQTVGFMQSRQRLVEEQMHIDYTNLQTAIDRLPILKQRAATSFDVVTGYEEQFTLGRRTLLDVLDVKNELFQAKVGLVDGIKELQIAQYQAHETLGQLTSVLGLNNE